MHIMDMLLSVSQKGAKMRQGRIYKMRYQIIKTYDLVVFAENEDKAYELAEQAAYDERGREVKFEIGDIEEVC